MKVVFFGFLNLHFSHSASSNILQLLSLKEPWTLIIDDALANSFVAPTTDDIKDDHQLTCKLVLGKFHFERYFLFNETTDANRLIS